MSLTSRACLATYGLAALFTTLSARLYYLAGPQHEKYAALAQTTYEARTKIPARRGAILDVQGAVLARNQPMKDVIVDDSLLAEFDQQKKPARWVPVDRQKVATLLAPFVDMTPEEVLTRIRPNSRYCVIKRKITEEQWSKLADAIAQAKLRGIWPEQNFQRVYPAGSLLCHVVGFYGCETNYNPVTKKEEGKEFKGLDGIERSMESWLKEQEGWRYYQRNGAGLEMASLRNEERAPRHGANVRLTVDLNVQQIVEDELEKAYKALKPKKATVIIMEPKTGAILAMANRPCYDPNLPGESAPEARRNHAVASFYEPGSTLKAVTAAGALNTFTGVRTTLDTKIDCMNGVIKYPGGQTKDHHPYGVLTVAEIIAKSSNIGAIKLALPLGKEKFYNLVRSFGFGSRTGVALPSETPGMLPSPARWTPGTMYHMPFGHEIAATPLQVITATCVFANGGTLMMPRIVRDVTDDTGHVLVDYPPQVVRENVIGKQVASDMTTALEKVTSKIGTAIRARVPGFRVAGKTGTTKIFDHSIGRYSDQDHTVSFVGYLPAEDPKFCCLVMIEDSATVNGTKDSGGLLAAPVFSKIAERTAHQLGLVPDPVLYKEEMDFRKAQAQAEAPAKGGR